MKGTGYRVQVTVLNLILTLLPVACFLLPVPVSAHEAYVLTPDEFHRGLQIFSSNPLAPLFSPQYFNLTILITACLATSFIVNFLWAASKFGFYLDRWIKKGAILGPFIVRLALSISFFYAAFENTMLGPEVSLLAVPAGVLIRFLEILIGLMVLFGVLVELAGLIGIAIFVYLARYYGIYIVTYLNYLGEMLVLFLFGLKFLTFDRLFLGEKGLFFNLEKFKKWEIPIIRLFYGTSLIFAGVMIKFLHQDLTVAVYNEYHLQDFFRADAHFIAAGAGVSEILIGLFILIGFGMRWTVLISVFFITLSLLYFHELIWPHYLLYGLSFALLTNSGDFLTVDHYLVPWLRRKMGIKVTRREAPLT